MSRAQRLLDLIQILRRHRFPLTGQALALELGISVRTLYRDIGTLQEQGARIEGEPGLGYVLRPGFMLPPLMFSEEELEALVLGSRWVAARADSRLGSAARDALAKISAVLPVELRNSLDCTTLLVGLNAPGEEEGGQLPILRSAIRTERKIDITYLDLKGAESTRTVWPIALSFFDEVRVLVAWCELRQTFRNFRADRISSLTVSDERYPRGRQTILREWRAQEGIPAQ